MVKSLQLKNRRSSDIKNLPDRTLRKQSTYKRLASMGKISVGIINELSSPIDATNRFINLALQHTGEHAQSRQFLLESKMGLRKTAVLIRRLNDYAKRIEKEFSEISPGAKKGSRLSSKR